MEAMALRDKIGEEKMSKHEDYIKAIKSNYPPSNYTLLREALDVSIELLSKEIPIEPTNQFSIDFGLGSCGECACGNLVTYQDIYCPKCGYKIYWRQDTLGK